MTASEIRQEARKSLTGKWGKAALATLVFFVIDYVISFVLNLVPAIGAIASTIISVPLSFGFIVVVMAKLKRGEEISYIEFFKNGFDKFAKVWQVTLWIFVKMLAPLAVAIVGIFIMLFGFTMSATSYALSANTTTGSLFTIIGVIVYIAGIIWAIPKSYLYKLALYIINDNPDMFAKDAVEKSAEIMNGHRWEFFWLQLTFIGWAFLACLTFGIGMLWLIPYIQVSTVAFYDNLIGNNDFEIKNDEPIEENPIQEN